MIYSVALPSGIHGRAVEHLVRPDRQEDVCFALWNPSIGSRRQTACIRELVLPLDDEREIHGNVHFSAEYFLRALSLARRQRCGLAIMHSHPAPGWQGMSPDDVHAEEEHAPAVFGATQLPLVGLTIGTDGAWSARFWIRQGTRAYRRNWCEAVRVVGDRLVVTYDDRQRPTPKRRDVLTRTYAAWGDRVQANLMRLRVGVIGAGSVGSIVAEGLARMGVAEILLLDFDVVERVNLDRLLHASPWDARLERFKVDVIAGRLLRNATAPSFNIHASKLSVVEEAGYRSALDCDLLFCCVDRPWPRFVLNVIAYAHLIPVIDGGLKMTPMDDERGLKRATWRAHVAAPTRRCLECLGQYDPGFVAVERSGLLEQPRYIENLPKDHELRASENVFGSSLSVAAMEIENFLRITVPHPGRPNVGAQINHFVRGVVENDTRPCERGCPFCEMVSMGDRTEITGFTGIHQAANRIRANHHQLRHRLRVFFTGFY